MFGPKLQELRKKKGWSIQYMAKLLGIAKSTYAGYETGYREPSLDTIRKAAALLEVSTDELLGDGHSAASAGTAPETGREDGLLEDAGLGLWFKELLEAPAERREELRQIWDIIKMREAGRSAGSRQGE